MKGHSKNWLGNSSDIENCPFREKKKKKRFEQGKHNINCQLNGELE